MSEERKEPVTFTLKSCDTDYDNLYYFLGAYMSFNYVCNLYRMLKERLEEIECPKKD